MQVEIQTEAAVAELHKLYVHQIYRYVYRRTLDQDLAKHIANDAFRLAWQRTIPVNQDALPWLLVTARNLLRNEFRSQGREHALTLKLAAEQRAQRPGQSSDTDAAVHGVLDALREKDREVLALAYWDGLELTEIASFLGCSLEAAKSRLFRARKAFERKAPKELLKGGKN